jgi:Trk K+ transport system NAD-binding subunit
MAVSPAAKTRTSKERARVHTIIAGCGRVGSELAVNLNRLGHTIAIVDKNPKAFERLKPGFNAKQVVGFVFDREVLEEAGIHEATAFASVTSGVVAVSRFGVPRVPDSSLTIQEGDILHISIVRGDLATIAESLKTVDRPE